MTTFRQGLLLGMVLGPVALALVVGLWSLWFGPWRRGRERGRS